MKKVLFFLILLIPLNVWALDFPEINSDKVIIYDLTEDDLIYEKNSTEVTSIASLTKILTVITAIENIPDLDAQVTVTSNMLAGIYWNASVAGFKVGNVVTYRDLLYGAILPSGADATQILAVSISGSIPKFVEKMNETALRIGMINSHFVNVTGLDTKNHYSTTEDVLTLLKYALKNATFKEVYTTKEYVLTNGLKVNSTIQKYNKELNLDVSRIIGSKSGFTDNAGLCLSTLFEFDSHEILIITIGAPYTNNYAYNLVDSLTLIDFIDNNYVIVHPVSTIENLSFTLTLKDEKVTVNYGLITFAVLIIIIFPILIVPRKKKRKRRKK